MPVSTPMLAFVTLSAGGVVHYSLGAAAPLAIAAVGVQRRNLTLSGAVAAWLIGFLVIALGGWAWFLAVCLVFVGVNVVSRIKRGEKPLDAKGATRDHRQLGANAGMVVPAALGYALTHHPLFLGAFLGTLAFAAADTFASELGVLSRRPPVSITTGVAVPAGTSGGVSRLGYLAATVGASIPSLALALGTVEPNVPALVMSVVAGLAGCTVDSVLGDLVQGRFECPCCGRSTERTQHCGQPTRHLAGWAWMDNDAVNLVGSSVSALVGAGLFAAAAGVLA